MDADGSPDCISARRSISLHWSSVWDVQPHLSAAAARERRSLLVFLPAAWASLITPRKTNWQDIGVNAAACHRPAWLLQQQRCVDLGQSFREASQSFNSWLHLDQKWKKMCRDCASCPGSAVCRRWCSPWVSSSNFSFLLLRIKALRLTRPSQQRRSWWLAFPDVSFRGHWVRALLLH